MPTPFETELARRKAEEASKTKAVAAPTMTAEKIDPAAIGKVTAGKVNTGIATGPVVSADQQAAVAMSKAAAEGSAPSFAEQLLRRQSENAVKQQASQMAGRSFNPAALRQAQLSGAQAQAAAGEQAAALRAQEMATARSEFGNLASQQRGQDISLEQSRQQTELGMRGQDIQQEETALRAAMANQGVDLDVLKTNAGMGNQAALANLDAQLKATGMDDARRAQYMQTLLSGQGTQAQIDQQAQQLAFAKSEADRAQRNKKEDRLWQLGGSLLGAGASLGAAALMGPAAAASDRNVKENIKEAKGASDWLDALTAFNYNYKQGKGLPEGNKTSVMAQDLEKAGPEGKQMVVEAADGMKVVDYGQGFAAMLAAMVDMKEQLNKIQNKSNKNS
jgi:hypothetical protein